MAETNVDIDMETLNNALDRAGGHGLMSGGGASGLQAYGGS